MEGTKYIYWVDHQSKSAVVYATWENFHKLKNLVSTTLLTAKAKTQSDSSYCPYDKLVFVDGNKDILGQFFIKNDNINHQNLDYTVAENALSHFIGINQARKLREDPMRSESLKFYINNYSDKCS